MFWLFHLREKNNKETPSNINEIQIHIPTKLAMLAEEMAVKIANNINIHHKIDIHHHKGIFSLFWIQKNINIPHLIKAHNANIHTISFPTKFTSFAHINKHQSITARIQITNKNEIYWVLLFFIALIIADNQENINDIPNKILTIPQNFEGLSIVIIPHIIINIASHNINRQDRSFFISDIWNK